MIGGQSLKELLQEEIIERQQEGCKVPASFLERLKSDSRAELEALYDELMGLEIDKDFPFTEPDGLDNILNAATGCDYCEIPDSETLFSQIHGAWLGRIVGCIMGKPIERSPFNIGDGKHKGWECIKLWQEGAGDAFPPVDYISMHSKAEEQGYEVFCLPSCKEQIAYAESDDDIRYMVLGLLINERYGNDFTAVEVADLWHKHLTKSMVFTAEYRAMLNSYACEETDPQAQIAYCHGYRNPYREWIGAQIRIDHYAYYNPGDPLSAAKAAFQDADFTHTKNGVYGAMFFAAAIAAAFTCKDIRKCIEIGLSVIPEKSRLYADIRFAMDAADSDVDTEALYRILLDRLGHYHPVHTNNNAAICVAALLRSGGDYVKAVSFAVGGGLDTDCNGATVGSFMGALLGVDAIPSYLADPLHDTLYSSIVDFHPTSIKACAKRTYDAVLKKAK